MERVRQKKSKVPITNEGNRQTQRRRSVPKLASDSSSYISGTTKEDLFTCELGRSSSRRVTGTPIKKLLAEEMSKETESKRRPASVIARLMGLDGLPPQQPLHRQHKGFSETYRQRTASVVCQRDGKPYERQVNRKNSIEQQEYKDVYEVLEISKVDRGSYSAKGTVNPKLSEAEMAFIRHMSMNAKLLSAEEKRHNSKEFCDTFDRLDTNKDLIMKYLQQPDSLFTKHLFDLKGAAPRSHHIAVIKPSNSVKYESNNIGWKSEKDTSQFDTGSHWKHHDSLSTHSYNHRGPQKPLKSSKIQLEGKHETDILPRRIVVLKPNLEKVRNASKSVLPHCSSHCYLSDCKKCMEYSSIGIGEIRPWVEKNLSSDPGFSRPKSREPREIAKEITRRMRESFCSEPINLSSIFKGYVGDESSYNVSGNDSASESEVSMLTSRKSFHWSNQQTPTSSHLIESSVSREAKKRLSERWKMSQRYQVVEIGKGSTLGEMLGIPDREMRPENLDPVIGLDESTDRFAGNDEITEWDNPLGISSRDGWKNGCVRNSSRLRFVPASCVGCGSPKTSMQRETLDQFSYLRPGEAMNLGRNKAIKGNLNKKEDSSSRNLKSDNKKLQSPCCTYGDNSDSLEEKQFNQSQMVINLGKKDPSDQKSLASEMPANNVNSTSSITDAEMVAEHEDMAMSSESPDELTPKPSPYSLGNLNSSTPGPEDSKAQEPQIRPSKEDPVPEPPSPDGSKEADNPSPVSVLEIAFTEEISSGSECFERVSADLHELRMQLKLLKMESGAYTDGGMLMSSDKDVGEGSIAVSEETAIFEDDSWVSSYLIDVLIDSGFDDDADPDMIMATWHSPECPLGPWVFDNLEKKYCNETWLRSERRLLFDRINSGLFEIFQWLTDPRPWVKLLTRKPVPELQKNGVKHELHKFLASEEKKASEDVTERVLDREMLWLDSGDGIDSIGRELEKMLIDELIAEVANM